METSTTATVAFVTGATSGPPSIVHQTVSLTDAKTELISLFETGSQAWETLGGAKVLSVRHATSDGFPTGAHVLNHVQQMTVAIKDELRLEKTPECFETKLLYGEINPMSMSLDSIQLGPMTLITAREIPSSWVRLEMSRVVAERHLARYYGNRAFECMKASHSKWEILEVTHPIDTPMTNYPLLLCDPSTIDRSRDIVIQDSNSPWLPPQTGLMKYNLDQKWMFFPGQQPFEVLVRKIASSSEANTLSVPVVSSNVTGDATRVPEHRITMRFVAWYP